MTNQCFWEFKFHYIHFNYYTCSHNILRTLSSKCVKKMCNVDTIFDTKTWKTKHYHNSYGSYICECTHFILCLACIMHCSSNKILQFLFITKFLVFSSQHNFLFVFCLVQVTFITFKWRKNEVHHLRLGSYIYWESN